MQATIVEDSAQRGVENVLTMRLTVGVSLQAFTNELQRIHQNLFGKGMNSNESIKICLGGCYIFVNLTSLANVYSQMSEN